MRHYRIASPGLDHLAIVDGEMPIPGPGEVLVALKASSLNFLDLTIVQGGLGDGVFPLTPVSDGAGEIAAVGPGVTGWAVGDRVVPHFALDRLADLKLAPAPALYRGVTAPGSAADHVVVPIAALVRIPDNLSFAEAATLPIAATTAFTSLRAGGIGLGSVVLLLGTGGVSLFALQLAKASGATVIITSSSDDKLARARELGADQVINYTTTPDWDREVLRLTGGMGADLVIDTAGPATFAKSLGAAAMDGTIAVVGFLTGMELSLSIIPLQTKRLTIVGIAQGSIQDFKETVHAMVAAGIRPVIDRTFSFEDLPAAFEHLKSGTHFGKIVIDHALAQEA